MSEKIRSSSLSRQFGPGGKPGLHGRPDNNQPSKAGHTPSPGASTSFGSLLAKLDHQQEALDRLVERGSRMQIQSGPRLLALQAQVYRYGQNLELTSRVVDRALSAVKTTLNIQI
jgi:hypothetical protein